MFLCRAHSVNRAAIAFLQRVDFEIGRILRRALERGLCNQRGVHGRGLKIWGRAPDALVFELGLGRFRSGDRKVAD